VLGSCRLREPEVWDAVVLFAHLSNPQVHQYSRLKPASIEQLMDDLKRIKHAEDVISRIIEDDAQYPVGMITLWDYCKEKREGFLATWIAQPYWGKGYNQTAKELFLQELFRVRELESIFLKVRKSNQRSLQALRKLPYIAELPSEENQVVRTTLNALQPEYLLFQIRKNTFLLTEKQPV